MPLSQCVLSVPLCPVSLLYYGTIAAINITVKEKKKKKKRKKSSVEEENDNLGLYVAVYG